MEKWLGLSVYQPYSKSNMNRGVDGPWSRGSGELWELQGVMKEGEVGSEMRGRIEDKAGGR